MTIGTIVRCPGCGHTAVKQISRLWQGVDVVGARSGGAAVRVVRRVAAAARAPLLHLRPLRGHLRPPLRLDRRLRRRAQPAPVRFSTDPPLSF